MKEAIGYTKSRSCDFPTGPVSAGGEVDQVGQFCPLGNLGNIQKGNRKMNRKSNEEEPFAQKNARTYKMLKHHAEVDDLRQANAAKRRAMWDGAIRYDNPLQDENGDDKEDRSLSDRGKGAEIIYMPDRQPEWFDEMVGVLDKLEGVERDVVNALFVDLRPQVAARIAGVNRQRIYRVMAKLREKLARAHELWLVRNS